MSTFSTARTISKLKALEKEIKKTTEKRNSLASKGKELQKAYEVLRAQAEDEGVRVDKL